MFPLTRTQVVARLVFRILHKLLVTFSLRPPRHSRCILWLQSFVWMSWYFCLWARGLYRTGKRECDMDCKLRLMIFIFQTLSHSFLVIRTLIQGLRARRGVRDKNAFILNPSDPWVALTVIAMIFPIVGVNVLIISNAANCSTRVWTFNMQYFPGFLALQLQNMSIIVEVMEANINVQMVKGQLQVLARELSSRWPQSKQKSEYLDQQIYRIVQIKQRYHELHQLFGRINDSYGGSLLIICIDFFASIVCNAYWLFVDVRSRPLKFYAVLMHFLYIFNVAMQMSAVCWHCQQGFNLSRQIGCLISKLVKPMGSKRYNDLVSEFSLQTLHQRFVVTAKDFFSLNLHLLSSMFAAVVTYLVILIQFMFAERSANGSH